MGVQPRGSASVRRPRWKLASWPLCFCGVNCWLDGSDTHSIFHCRPCYICRHRLRPTDMLNHSWKLVNVCRLLRLTTPSGLSFVHNYSGNNYCCKRNFSNLIVLCAARSNFVLHKTMLLLPSFVCFGCYQFFC